MGFACGARSVAKAFKCIPTARPSRAGVGPRRVRGNGRSESRHKLDSVRKIPPPPGAAIHSPPSDLPAPAGEVDLPAPWSGGDLADLPAPFSGGALADLPAPKKGARSLDFDPFEDAGVADLPAPKAQPRSPDFDPFADIDLPAPFVGPSGSEVDLPAPMGASSARGIDPMAEEIDLPMALTDAELPRPRAASAVPAPISLDSRLADSERLQRPAGRARRLPGSRVRRTRTRPRRRADRS